MVVPELKEGLAIRTHCRVARAVALEEAEVDSSPVLAEAVGLV